MDNVLVCSSQWQVALSLSGAIIRAPNLTSNTADALEALQTIDQLGQTRVDCYAEQVVNIAP